MLVTYQALARLALDEFKDVVTGTTFVGGAPASLNKMRLTLAAEFVKGPDVLHVDKSCDTITLVSSVSWDQRSYGGRDERSV